MAGAATSLRLLVKHLLVSEFIAKVRVTRSRIRRSARARDAYVETFNVAGQVAMLFFRHQDGTWRPYPPGPERPAMRAW